MLEQSPHQTNAHALDGRGEINVVVPLEVNRSPSARPPRRRERRARPLDRDPCGSYEDQADPVAGDPARSSRIRPPATERYDRVSTGKPRHTRLTAADLDRVAASRKTRRAKLLRTRRLVPPPPGLCHPVALLWSNLAAEATRPSGRPR